MGDTYVINGPTTIGDAGQLNEILGDVSLANITVTQGDMVYADALNDLTRLAAPAPGNNTSVMLFNNGSGSQPVWLLHGSVGDVLTVTGTNTIGWSNSNNEASAFGFSAIKANLFSVAGVSAATASNINGWTTTGTGLFDNTSGAFDSGGGVFTASANGIYLINFGLQLESATNGAARTLQLIKNGSQTLASQTFQPASSTAVPATSVISDQFLLQSGDFVQSQVLRTAVNVNENLRIQAGSSTFWSVAKMANQ